jgi:hypothetical protein
MGSLKWRVFGFAALIGLVIAVGTAGVVLMQAGGEPDWPTVKPTSTLDPADESAIKSVIEHSYELKASAGQTFDISQFNTVYTNDPLVPLNAEQAEFLKNVRNAHPGVADTVQGMSSDGWLAFKIAQTLNWKRGAEALEQLEANARAKGSDVTAEDYSSITNVVGMPSPRQNVTIDKTTIIYQELKVDGTHADVVYDDGAALARAFLVKTAAGWRIAGVRAIDIHF